jgi:hypothetical protein
LTPEQFQQLPEEQQNMLREAAKAEGARLQLRATAHAALASVNDRKKFLKIIENIKTPEQRRVFLEELQVAEQEYEKNRPGFVGRVLMAPGRGAIALAQSYWETLGGGGTDEQRALARQVRGAEGRIQVTGEDDPWIQKAVTQAAEQLLPAVSMIRSGAIAGKPGLAAAAFPQAYRSADASMAEKGIDYRIRKPMAALIGLATGFLEGIIPNPVQGPGKAAGKGLSEYLKNWGVHTAKQFAGEWSEEFAQGAADQLGQVIANWADATVPNEGLGSVVYEAWKQGMEAVGPLIVMMGAPATVHLAAGMPTQQEQDQARLMALPGKLEAGEKVSRRDANALKRLGIVDLTGLSNAKQRTAAAIENRDAIEWAAMEVQEGQQQQEITDAQRIEEATPPDAGGRTRVEAEVPQGTEPVGGEGVRGGGQAGWQVPGTETQVTAGPPATQEEVRASIERALGQGITVENWLRGTAEGRAARKKYKESSLRQFWESLESKQPDSTSSQPPGSPTVGMEGQAVGPAPTPVPAPPTQPEAAQEPDVAQAAPGQVKKEPWQMTREEFVNDSGEWRAMNDEMASLQDREEGLVWTTDKRGYPVQKKKLSPADRTELDELRSQIRDLDARRKAVLKRITDRDMQHSDEVEQALAAGKPVPPEVLAEYPNLQPQTTTQPKAPEPAPGETTPSPPVSPPPAPPPGGPPVGPAPSVSPPYGIKHAMMDVVRQQLGMPGRVPEAPYTDQQAVTDALTKTPAEVDAAISRIGSGRGEGKLDNAMMLRRVVELGTSLEAANTRGDKVGAQNIVAELAKVVEADTIGGTKAGRELQSRKMVADSDMSLIAMTVRRIKANGGLPLTSDEIAQVQELANKYKAEKEALEARLDEEASARLAAEEKLAETEAKEKASARRKRAAAKAGRLKAERRRELYDAAEQAGVGAKALQARAMEILDSDPKVQNDREYNQAFSEIERATGLTPLVIRSLENRRFKERTGEDVGTPKPVDINEYKGLDKKAPILHREYPQFFKSPPPSEDAGAAQDTGTSVAELIDGLKGGRKEIPSWRDYIEEAARSLNVEAGYWEAGGEVVGPERAPDRGDAWEPPVEEAEGAPAAGKKPTRKSARQRTAAADKRQAALTRLKAAWQALGTVGAAYDPQAEAAKQAELISAAMDVGRAYVEEGIVRLSAFLAEARASLANNFDQLRPHLIDAWNQLRAAGEVPSPMVDTTDRAELGRMARAMHREFIEAGVPDRESRVDAVWAELQLSDPNITRRETMDAMSGYGDFKELRKDEVSIEARKDRGQLQQLAKLQDLNRAIAKIREWRAQGMADAQIAKELVDRGLLPKKSGIERRKVDDIERALLKDVNALKKQLPVQPVPSEQQLATAFSTAQTTIRNRIADLKEALRLGREIPTGTKPAYSPDQQAKIDAMKKELAEWTEKYRKLFPTKTQRAKMDRAAEKEAQAQWEEEGGQGDVKTQQQRVLEAANVLDGIAKRMQEELDQLKAEGWKKKPNAPPLNAPMLVAKRAKIDAIKAQRSELLKLDPAKQADDAARADAAYTRALSTRLAKNLERLATMKETGVIPPKKPVRKLSPEQLAIKKRMADLAKEDALEVERIRWNNFTRMEKAARIPGTVFKGLKSLWGSFDLSFIGRQGLSLALAHPIKAVQAQRRSAGAFMSEDKAFEIQENIRIRKNYLNGVYQRMKLELTGLDEAAVALEEEYAVHWPEKIPVWGRGIRASGRAFVAQGNQQRADVADAMVASLLRKDPAEATDAELEIIGHYINAASWRGDVTGWEQAAVKMNNFFWTPRGYVGQFQHLLGTAYWLKRRGESTARVRRVILKEYARELAGRAVFYGTAIAFLTAAMGPPSDDEDGWSIILNPYSADFGKVRLGRRRIDVMGGLAQPTRFLFRETTNLINGFRKLAGAEISTESQKEMEKWWSTAGRFLLSKVAPTGSLLGGIATGETYEGDDLTARRLAADIITPLSFREIYESMKDMGVPAGSALAVLAIFGFGGMTYKEKKKPVKGRKLRTLRKVEPR